MNNFGFTPSGFSNNNYNNDNPLMDYLKQLVKQPQENAQTASESQRTNNVGVSVFEINSKSDIEYIEQDKSGRMQVYVCPNEKRIYTSRYNHVKKEPDYKVYIEEEEVKLFQKPDTSAEMSQIAEALVAVVNRLETMDNAINEIKNIKPIEIIKEVPVEIIKEVPKTEKTNRKPNGQFKKKGES